MCTAAEAWRGGAASRHRGVTLVEVVVAMVIISIALVVVMGVLRFTATTSANPVVQRQTLAVAESMLHEVLNQPYTAMDLNGVAQGMGPEAGETRYSQTTPFNHVMDYAGFSMSGILAIDATAVAGLSGYSVSVAEQQQALGGIVSGEGLLVTVTATGPDGYSISLSGYRARYSP